MLAFHQGPSSNKVSLNRVEILDSPEGKASYILVPPVPALHGLPYLAHKIQTLKTDEALEAWTDC